MLEVSLVEIFTTPLNASKIEYMVTGSVAALMYGEPRLTHDVDLVIDLKKEYLKSLVFGDMIGREQPLHALMRHYQGVRDCFCS